MAGLWQQLSSLRQGQALVLLHFSLHLLSGAQPGDTQPSPHTLEVRQLPCYGNRYFIYRFLNDFASKIQVDFGA